MATQQQSATLMDVDGKSALVVLPKPTAGTMVPFTGDELAAEITRMQQMANDMLTKAEKETSIRAGGFSVPVRIDRVKPNNSEGYEQSYNILATLGSFRGWNCPTAIIHDDMVFIRLDPGKNLKDTPGAKMPVSQVLGMEIPYVMLHRGDKRMIFTGTETAETFGNKRFAYLVSIHATYTAKPPSATSVADASSSSPAGDATYAPPPPSPMMAAAGDANPYMSSTRKGGYQSKMAPISGIADFNKPDSPKQSDGSLVVAASTSALVSTYDAGGQEDPAAKFLRHAFAILPARSICTEPFISKELKEAYLDPTSALTPGERLAIELKFPDVVPNRIPPNPDGGKPQVGTFALNCDDVLPIQMRKYTGEDDRDMLQLYCMDPEIETNITPQLLIDNPDAVLVVGSVQGAEYTKMMGDRISDKVGVKPFFSTVKWRTTIETGGAPLKPQNAAKTKKTKTTPLLSYLKKTGDQPSLSGTAYVMSWPEGPYMLAGNNFGHATIHFNAYSGVLEKFGILYNDTWVRFAPIIVENTEIWMSMVRNAKKTARLKFNLTKSGTPKHQQIVAKVIDIVHDLSTALRKRIGIPVTVRAAAAISGIELPTDKMVAEADPKKIGDVTNLCECKTTQIPRAVFAAAIAAGCDFFVLADSKIVKENCSEGRPNYRCLEPITPEMGDLMFTPEWYDCDKDVTLPISRTVIKADDRIRKKTAYGVDLSDLNTHKLVFAVRKSEAASADRARKAIDIFRSGVSLYDPVLGIPIIESTPTVPAVVASEAPKAIAAPPALTPQQSIAVVPTPSTTNAPAQQQTTTTTSNPLDDDMGFADESELAAAEAAAIVDQQLKSTTGARKHRMPSATKATAEPVTRRRSSRSRSPGADAPAPKRTRR